MIDLHFHWAWLLIAAVVIFGVFIAYPMLNEDNDRYGITGAMGCVVMVVAVLLALVIGGIFIW